MLPKAHLTSHSRMSDSRSVIIPSWLSGSLISFLYSSSVYSCHLLLSSASSHQLCILYIVVCILFGCMHIQSPSCIRLFVTPWTAPCQTPVSVAYSRQEYWSGLPFPSPGDLLYQVIESVSSALAGKLFTTESPGKPVNVCICQPQSPNLSLSLFPLVAISMLSVSVTLAVL